MAFPLLALSTLFTVGSAVANAAAARSQAKARDQSLAAERIRQRGLDQEAAALNTRSQDRYENFEQQREVKNTELGDYFAGAMPDAGAANAVAASVMPTATNDIVVREMAKQSGNARRFTDQQAGALADMRAFGDLLGDNARLQARDAGEIGQIGGFKRGSSNILPMELEEASQKGAGARFLGDILGGLGSIGMNAALTRGPMTGTLAGGVSPARSVRPVRNPLYPTGVY